MLAREGDTPPRAVIVGADEAMPLHFIEGHVGLW
jgi:hypothetical protein